MAVFLSAGPPTNVGRQVFDQMPDHTDERWRQDHICNEPLSGQWSSNTNLDLQGMQAAGERSFQHSGANYVPSYNWNQDQMLSPTSVGFDQAHWITTMSMETTSPTEFNNELNEQFQHQHQPPSAGAVQNPNLANHRPSSSIHSPQTSHSGLSPTQTPANLTRVAITGAQGRPGMNRSITAPVRSSQKSKQLAQPTLAAASLKHERLSDDDEDDALPIEDANGAKPRGRKRQRIPHTAVERRYRENLNAHLDKLRHAIPAITSRHPGVDRIGGSEVAKPSKCEVLSGAIEHIGDQERRILSLQNENQVLRARLAELEGGWYHRGPH